MKENDTAREGTGLSGTHLIKPGQTPKLTVSYKGTDNNIAKNAFVRLSADCCLQTAVRK